MRQFLAIELPRPARERLAALGRDLSRRSTGFRFISAESLHLTLRFLGEVDEALDAAARPEWRRAAAGVGTFSVRLRGIGVFPPRGRPRILWVGVEEAGARRGLERLARDLELAARGLGFAPEDRAFEPHLTLARARGAARAPEDRAWADPAAVEVVEVTLFRSRLDPAGARYTALDRYPLGSRT